MYLLTNKLFNPFFCNYAAFPKTRIWDKLLLCLPFFNIFQVFFPWSFTRYYINVLVFHRKLPFDCTVYSGSSADKCILITKHMQKSHWGTFWFFANIYFNLPLLYLYIFDGVVTPHVERMLGGFHHRVARWLTGKQPQRLPAPLREGMREDGLEDVETEITWIQFMVAQYIVMQF